MALLQAWLELAACAALIGFAGPLLIRYGDVIARATGLSRSWIGLVLIATATSLPELFTGMSAIILVDAPDIAVGDALGSCVFNLLMLVLLDELSRTEPLYRRIDQQHILSAGFGVILIASAGAFLVLSQSALDIGFLHISGYTPLIIAIYLVAMRSVFVHERRLRPPPASIEPERRSKLHHAVLCYAGAAGLVAAAGFWLPFVGKKIAEAMGWQTSFVGTILIASATSLPELVVTVSALRVGAVDMAIGSLLGSNLFDILILAADDLAYRKGPLLAAVSPIHAITALAATVMSGIFIVAVLYKPETRLRGTISSVSLSLLVVYLLSTYAVYLLGH